MTKRIITDEDIDLPIEVLTSLLYIKFIRLFPYKNAKVYSTLYTRNGGTMQIEIWRKMP